MTTDEYTCPDCGETIDVSVCHCGDGPNDSAHRGEDSHHFTPYNRCRCAVIREGIFEGVRAAIATARAEAALAEREACAEIARGSAEMARLPKGWEAARGEAIAIDHAIRARTTPATLSTETLAAIAEARGLRVVEPELLAGLEPPVLRWRDDEQCWGAIVGPWRVEATEGSWRVRCEHKIEGVYEGRSTIDFGRKSDLRDNRRAAEAALRSLGVAFRVEEDGAK